MLDWSQIDCPFCGEPQDVAIDPSNAARRRVEYIEDCQVCCRAIVFVVRFDADGALVGVDARRGDD